MLGDNPEKTKNPLKKAMRRRNGKTVQFAPPTYVEPPDVEYSTEEEMDSDAEYNHHNDESTEVQDGDQDVERDEPTAVEPLQSRKPGNDFDSTDETRTSGDSQLMDNQRTAADSERASDEALERSGIYFQVHSSSFLTKPTDDATAAGRSRKGTVRNTDSFFKDDNMETRKINLTPSLLRDDSSGSTIKSTEGKEVSFFLFLDHSICLLQDLSNTREGVSIRLRNPNPRRKARKIRSAKRKKAC